MIYVKIQGIAVDDEGNEQPVELLLDVGSFSASGNTVHGTVSTEHGDDVGRFKLEVVAPFKPYSGWTQCESADTKGSGK